MQNTNELFYNYIHLTYDTSKYIYKKICLSKYDKMIIDDKICLSVSVVFIKFRRKK